MFFEFLNALDDYICYTNQSMIIDLQKIDKTRNCYITNY